MGGRHRDKPQMKTAPDRNPDSPPPPSPHTQPAQLRPKTFPYMGVSSYYCIHTIYTAHYIYVQYIGSLIPKETVRKN